MNFSEVTEDKRIKERDMYEKKERISK